MRLLSIEAVFDDGISSIEADWKIEFSAPVDEGSYYSGEFATHGFAYGEKDFAGRQMIDAFKIRPVTNLATKALYSIADKVKKDKSGQTRHVEVRVYDSIGISNYYLVFDDPLKVGSTFKYCTDDEYAFKITKVTKLHECASG